MKQIFTIFALSVCTVFFSNAQLKKDFNVNFTYANGTTYNRTKARNDFGSVTRWNREHNTTIQNNALRVKFTKGLYGPDCGFTGSTKIKPAQHVELEYKIKFEKDFDFRKGGKLPGLGGGTTPSGGESAADGKGFTARSSWTKSVTGLFNVYAYFKDQQSPTFGDNLNSDFIFKANKWYVVRLEVKMNTGSNKNGYCKAFIDGKQVLSKSNLRWMTKENEIDEVSFSIFMGGNNNSFSPDHTQYLWIDYIKVRRVKSASSSGPAGYSFAANEKGTVNISSPVDVAYGANGKFKYRMNQTKNLTCNNSTFGDPIPGVAKKCYVRSAASSLNGVYYLKHKNTGLYLDSDGSNVKVSSGKSGNDKKWKLVKTDGNYYNIDSEFSGRGVLESQDNGGVRGTTTQSKSLSNNKEWKAVSLGNNEYRFENRVHNRDFLTINTSSKKIKYSSSTNANSVWVLVPANASKSANGVDSLTSNEKDINSFSIYPNPVEKEFVITTHTNESATVDIYNMNGQLIYKTDTDSGSVRMSVEGRFAQGMYVVKVTDIEGNQNLSKMIVK